MNGLAVEKRNIKKPNLVFNPYSVTHECDSEKLGWNKGIRSLHLTDSRSDPLKNNIQ
jgi:hypothetical protein